MKKMFFSILLVSLTSCFSLNRPEFHTMESFQICNTSLDDVTIHFYEQKEPYTAYYEIYNQSFPIYATPDNCKRDLKSLLNGNELTIRQGETILFYAYIPTLDKNNASCLIDCANYENRLFLYSGVKYFMGDSVVVSLLGETKISLPVQNGELWETWYDEQSFCYYHVWKID